MFREWTVSFLEMKERAGLTHIFVKAERLMIDPSLCFELLERKAEEERAIAEDWL